MDTKRLNKVKKFFKKNHRFPSYSEMLALFKLASKNSIYKIVNKWIEQGLVEKDGSKLAPTKKFFQLPMVGDVKAGFPDEAYEEVDFLSLSEYLIERPHASFLLKVEGDSLQDIGILAGDLVIIERKRDAKNNQIVLAHIDNDWTLKIFKKLGRKIYLEAANQKYPPFYPQESLEIFGVVKGVIRKVE
jgi:repressor LexA